MRNHSPSWFVAVAILSIVGTVGFGLVIALIVLLINVLPWQIWAIIGCVVGLIVIWCLVLWALDEVML